MPKIFISYRRVDSMERTHRIADWLTLKYGARNVFVDVDRLGGGVDFEDVLQQSLERANVLLVIIGEKWLDELNRREADRQAGRDYVYLEVVQGLQKNIDLVIPVMINNTPNPQPEQLPIEMHELTRRQSARVRSNPDFHKDMDIIRQLIDRQFWYERVIRYSLGFVATVATILLIAFFLQPIINPPPPTQIAEADALNTAIPRTLTALARPSATETPDRQATLDALVETEIAKLTQTQLAIIAETEAQFTETPTSTATLTSTPQPTATSTPNATRTAESNATSQAQVAQATLNAQNEIATQRVQATNLAPTNTPQPTFTATVTATLPPTVTATATSTATATIPPTTTPDTIATTTAQANATETQIAVATQIVATVQAQLPVTVGRVSATLGDGLNLRAAPNTEASIVTAITPGDIFIVLDATTETDWMQIETLDGRQGWLATQFVSILGDYPRSELDNLRELLQVVNDDETWQPIVREFDGVPMVLVPAGCFDFGVTPRLIETMQELNPSDLNWDDEEPSSEICVPFPYWIDQFEVSQEQFEQMGGVIDAEPTFVGDELPRDNTTWLEARAYCELRGGYLPSEVQWEYAARGVQSFVFPWGNDYDGDAYHWNQDTTTAVDDYSDGASWVGAYQMQGNVSEWTLSAYYGYPNPTRAQIYLDNFQDLENSNRPIPVVRGTSYFDGLRGNARNTNRIPASATNRRDEFGIRCVRDWQ
ncbi:MAG: SUMF1/EgtB/PvdO family nonheme iron enzyme [Chloroflexota bacterium]